MIFYKAKDIIKSTLKAKYFINKRTFIVAKTEQEIIKEYDRLLEIDLNDLVYIRFNFCRRIKYKFFQYEIEEVFLKNNSIYNLYNSAWNIYIKNTKTITRHYFFNEISYSYEIWKELPERIRLIREEKLNLL